MSGRFDYVRYDDKAAEQQKILKDVFLEAEARIEKYLCTGRAKALAFTALEESYMWVGKQIRDEQLQRGGDATDQPKRGE